MRKIGELKARNVVEGNVICVMGKYFTVIDSLKVNHRVVINCGSITFEYLSDTLISIYDEAMS